MYALQRLFKARKEYKLSPVINIQVKEKETKVNKLILTIMAVSMIAALAIFGGTTQAQNFQRAYRLTDKEVEQIIHNLESNAKAYRSSLDSALDQSRLDGTRREDDINARIKDFEEATKQLHDHFDNHKSVSRDVEDVLQRAARIDEFMRRQPLDQRAQQNWLNTKSDLDRLADAYSVRWIWDGTYPPTRGETLPARINDRQVERLLRAVEKDADAFRKSLDRALDRSPLDGTAREDNINQFVKDFRETTRQLRDRFNGHTSVAADVESVLARAQFIDDFMRRRPLDRRAQNDWGKVRNDLFQLARAYNVAWTWINRR